MANSSLNRQAVLSMFGVEEGTKLLQWLDPCCTRFCKDVSACLPPISGPTGSEPLGPSLGQFYFDITLVKMKFWNGTTWAILASTP